LIDKVGSLFCVTWIVFVWVAEKLELVVRFCNYYGCTFAQPLSYAYLHVFFAIISAQSKGEKNDVIFQLNCIPSSLEIMNWNSSISYMVKFNLIPGVRNLIDCFGEFEEFFLVARLHSIDLESFVLRKLWDKIGKFPK